MIETASQLGERIQDTLGQVGALGRTAARKLDHAGRGTADALAGSAASMRNAGEAIDDIAERAASGLDSTAAYVRRHDTGRIGSELRQIVRKNPAALIAAGTAIGFLLGFALRGRASNQS